MPGWTEFFEKYPKKGPKYLSQIKTLADEYPDRSSLYVSYEHLEHYDVDFAMNLDIHPEKVLDLGIKAIKEIVSDVLIDDGADEMDLQLRIVNCPRSLYVDVRNIRGSRMLGKIVVVEGIANRTTEVLPSAVVAAFKCRRCQRITMIEQTTPFLQEPMECAKTEDGGGGCGRAASSTKFDYLMEESKMVDGQRFEIQESPEGLRGGRQPQSIVAHIFGDACGQVAPGDKVIIVGILKGLPKGAKSAKLREHDLYLHGLSIELIDVESEEIEISEEEMAQIDVIRNDHSPQSLIVQSIAPSIYGLETIKKAMMLMMFSGVAKVQPDGTRIRGDSHTLLVGDPGTAKTQLLRYQAFITPRSIYASGKGTTAAGLTACAVQSTISGGGDARWTLEAGALVLSDGGLCCIDELDKMSDQDRSAMHEALESQSVTINKATIHVTLSARSGVLAAANPKFGRFEFGSNSAMSIAEQIDLPSTLISRFDLIFPIADVPDQDLDQSIASHILTSHFAGEVSKRMALEGKIDDDTESRYLEAINVVKPAIPPEVLKKYVFLARKIIPIMSIEAMKELDQYYTDIRHKGGGKTIPITARQLEGLVRLAEASARSRMSDTVSVDDATYAIEIVDEFLKRVVGTEEGAYDMDSLFTGIPTSQREIMRVLDREMDSLGSFTEEEFIEAAKVRGISDGKAQAAFDRFKRDGAIYMKVQGAKETYHKVR